MAEAEENNWTPQQIDPDYKRAGSSKLSIFAEYSLVSDIAERYSLDPEEVLNWKYSKVFIDVALNVARNDVSREYQQIKTDKYKK